MSIEVKRKSLPLVDILIVLFIVIIIIIVALPNLKRARIKSNEASAIKIIQKIAGAEEIYRTKSSPPEYTDLKNLALNGLIDKEIVEGKKNGYIFKMIENPTGDSFAVVAIPSVWGKTGTRSFYMDHGGTIRIEEGKAANENSKPLKNTTK